MTTCAECLNELSTMRVSDMRPGTDAAVHMETCPRCAAVAQEIAYAERRLLVALNDARSAYPPEEIADAALTGSERERRQVVGRWTRGILAASGCVTLVLFFQNVIMPRANQSEKIRTETISLRCLTPEQAIEIATPYLRTGSISAPKGMRMVTVRARHEEFVQATARINMIDDAQKCGLPNPAYIDQSANMPRPQATSTDKPGKD